MLEFADYLQYELFQRGDYVLLVKDVVLAVFIVLVWAVLFWFATRRWLPRFYAHDTGELESEKKQKAGRMVLSFFLLLGLTGIVRALGLNWQIYPAEPVEEEAYALYVNTILQALAALQFARLADWLFSNIIIRNYKNQRKSTWFDNTYSSTVKKKPKRKEERTAGVLIQSIVYAFTLYFLIRLFYLDQLFPTLTFGEEGKAINITFSRIAMIFVIFFAARFLAWIVTQLFLFNYYRSRGVNIGDQYAVNQLIRYFIFFIAVIVALNSLGLQLTVVWGAVAALLVGVGLGLQQTFNDWASGIILLLERTVEVGDIVQVEEGTVGTVRKIGLRVSRIDTLQNISVLVPNSMLVNDKVINWSHFDNKARFVIKIGVAYGSDTKLVKDILVNIAQENDYVMKYPDPFVRFVDFGASSLDFELHIWSQALKTIEDIKSDLRFRIDEEFRKNDIQIPFPQRDVWIRTEE